LLFNANSSAVDLEPCLGQTKDYNIGICCFSAKYAALRREHKNWVTRNQDNVFEWGDMSTHGLVFFSELALSKSN